MALLIHHLYRDSNHTAKEVPGQKRNIDSVAGSKVICTPSKKRKVMLINKRNAKGTYVCPVLTLLYNMAKTLLCALLFIAIFILVRFSSVSTLHW